MNTLKNALLVLATLIALMAYEKSLHANDKPKAGIAQNTPSSQALADLDAQEAASFQK